MTDAEQVRVDTIKAKLAIHLLKYRRNSELTQAQMAARCGMHQGNYSQIENGKLDKVTIDQLIKLNFRVGTKFKLLQIAQK